MRNWDVEWSRSVFIFKKMLNCLYFIFSVYKPGSNFQCIHDPRRMVVLWYSAFCILESRFKALLGHMFLVGPGDLEPNENLGQNFHWKNLSVISIGKVWVKWWIRHFLCRPASNTMIRTLKLFAEWKVIILQDLSGKYSLESRNRFLQSYCSCVIFALSCFILNFLV